MTTGKTIALSRRTFFCKITFLLFNKLSRLVIAFLPRNKHLLISWLQSPSAMILKPPKIKSVTVSIVSPSISHEVMGPDAMILVFWMLSFKPTFTLSFTTLSLTFSLKETGPNHWAYRFLFIELKFCFGIKKFLVIIFYSQFSENLLVNSLFNCSAEKLLTYYCTQYSNIIIWTFRQHIKKQRHYFVNTGLSSQSYVYSSSHVWMWELDHKDGWALKNWCFWTVVLKKTVESLLDCKEIKSVNPKGNQSWICIGTTDAKAEAPIFSPPDMNNWLIGKDLEPGKDWKQEEKGMTEGEMIGWHHWIDGLEFEQTPGIGDGQGCLACCSLWGHKLSDTTELLNWNESYGI